MSRTLPLTVLLFLLSFPTLGHAASISNSFKSSSSGSETITVSDTIQFEVTVTADAGFGFNSVLWSITGDVAGALLSSPGSGWAGVDHQAVDWEWNYSPPGSATVDIGLVSPKSVGSPSIPVPDRVSGSYGWFGPITAGSGVPSMVGTVTIHADALGTFQGGGFQFPGVDGFMGTSGSVSVPISGGAFTVVPEPGTALLTGLGLCVLAAGMRRRR